ncbi:hypothetical protein Taro_037197, partial [Colocasia esculenta]|nr:hypothetical protein [Colocasia esculenta]
VGTRRTVSTALRNLVIKRPLPEGASLVRRPAACFRGLCSACLGARLGERAARVLGLLAEGGRMEDAAPVLQIYNTMTKQKEVFRPGVPGEVRMYVCGVTPYDYSHIGHARAYVSFDVLHRYLKHLGYKVTYVRNFTDIDDKLLIFQQIINRANLSGEDPLSLSRRFSEEFLKDMVDLHCLSPTHEPRVSHHIDQIKDMISKIIDQGCAYTIDGDVYFSVDNFPQYGRLSGRKLDDNRAGGGGRVSIDSRKRNFADFALWKSAKPGEPSWESPWGPGRPGWHIECSAMSAYYLGNAFDIHGGGQDLIFPHHENEIAQSCAACPDSNVSYWMHNGFVNKDNEKMSKSLNNFFTIRDTLLDCEEALAPFREGILSDRMPPEIQKSIAEFHTVFLKSMSDDMHTSEVLGSLVELLRSINNNIKSLKKLKAKRQQLPLAQALAALEKEVKDVLNVLGLMSSSTCSEVLQQLKDKALKRAGLTEEEVLEQIKERTLARKNKDYEKSDQIRKELYAKGISLMDEPKGTIWRPCEPPENVPDNANSENQSNPPLEPSNPANPSGQVLQSTRQPDDANSESQAPQALEQKLENATLENKAS